MVPGLLQLLARELLQVGALMAMVVLAVPTSPSARADLSETIDRIKPSVVMVGTYLETSSPKFALLGTGFAVGARLVATNAHVVQPLRGIPDGGKLVVLLPDSEGREQMRTAVLHGLDETHDLAVLRLPAEGAPLRFLELGKSEEVRDGAAIAFTGFPIGAALGFSPVTHRGIVSAVTSIAPPSPDSRTLDAKRVRAIKAGPFQVFQLDATAYPGNSGGPVFDPESGRVLGVVNMVFVKGARESALSEPSGISYAIPSQHLRPMIQDVSGILTHSPEKP